MGWSAMLTIVICQWWQEERVTVVPVCDFRVCVCVCVCVCVWVRVCVVTNVSDLSHSQACGGDILNWISDISRTVQIYPSLSNVPLSKFCIPRVSILISGGVTGLCPAPLSRGEGPDPSSGLTCHFPLRWVSLGTSVWPVSLSAKTPSPGQPGSFPFNNRTQCACLLSSAQDRVPYNPTVMCTYEWSLGIVFFVAVFI